MLREELVGWDARWCTILGKRDLPRRVSGSLEDLLFLKTH